MERGCCLVIVLAMVAVVFCEGPIKVSECGVEDVDNKLVDLVDYSVSPDVVPVPGNFSLSLNLNLNRDLVNAQLDVEAYIKKKVTFFYAPIPCIKEVGSCTYDLCTLFEGTFADDCPAVMVRNSIPCTCSNFSAGTYSMSTESIAIPKLGSLWSWLAKGDYKVQIKVRDRTSGQSIGCVNIAGSLRDPENCGWFGCGGFFGDKR